LHKHHTDLRSSSVHRSTISLAFKSKNASQTVCSEYERLGGDYSPSTVICLAKFDVEFTLMLDAFLTNEKVEELTIRIPKAAEYKGNYVIELDQTKYG
jgi:hypothetical protein